jgi:hypothetical protein
MRLSGADERQRQRKLRRASVDASQCSKAGVARTGAEAGLKADVAGRTVGAELWVVVGVGLVDTISSPRELAADWGSNHW